MKTKDISIQTEAMWSTNKYVFLEHLTTTLRCFEKQGIRSKQAGFRRCGQLSAQHNFSLKRNYHPQNAWPDKKKKEN